MNYDYYKNTYRVIAADEIEADAASIQKELIINVGHLIHDADAYHCDDATLNDDNPKFVSATLEKIKKNKIQIISRKCNSLIKDDQLWRSKTWANNKYTTKEIQICSNKNQSGATFRIKKNFSLMHYFMNYC